jgi:hypothetical protein
MAIRLPSHLHRARSRILHFRIAIRPDLRHHFTTREIYRSLRTASVRDATPRGADARPGPQTRFSATPQSYYVQPEKNDLLTEGRQRELEHAWNAFSFCPRPVSVTHNPGAERDRNADQQAETTDASGNC